jgi:acyl carrier protein
VPVGVAGELYIGGDGLARGYLNRAELTSEKFIANPFSDDPTARLYKTGDLARYLADGNIEFLGRIDHQVKVRGYRIELGEIESVLNEHPGVSESVVVAREDEPGDKRLVAYLVGSESETPALSELRSYLKEKLPKYMVPSSFVTLERIPLTVNGKVDRLALPAPEETRPELEEAYVAPRSALEDVIAGIWADVLRVERVGVDDNFFELGGHSLNLTKVLLQVQDALQVKVPLRTLFEEPTVGQLAKEITRVRPGINQEIAQTIRELKQLSGDEVKRMLSE